MLRCRIDGIYTLVVSVEDPQTSWLLKFWLAKGDLDYYYYVRIESDTSTSLTARAFLWQYAPGNENEECIFCM